MKYEIKSIRIWSFLKVMFFINILVGILGGFVFAFFTATIVSALGTMEAMNPYGLEMPQDFPLGALFIIYPIMGAMASAFFLTLFEIIVIGLYNLIAKLTGGLELNLHEIMQVIPAQSPIAAQTQAPQYGAPPPPSKPAEEETPQPPVQYQPPPSEPPQNNNDDNNEFPTRTVGG